MLKSDFYYNLPDELIAQTPLEPRDSSKLMAVSRESGAVTHDRFYNICDYLREGDLLVMNDSKVFPARIFGQRQGTGGNIEFLLLKRLSLTDWEVTGKPLRRLKEGVVVDFPEGLSAEVISREENDYNLTVRFNAAENIYEVLNAIGQMPLPPYITAKLENKDRYNTVYCKTVGSAAAPTAGLHFTDKVFESLKTKGVDTAYVTLHVGLGTFLPVKENNILDHKMHCEEYTIPPETVEKIKACKARGGRVIAVGTTSCRTLESTATELGEIQPCTRSTSIFIYPGYDFKVIDGLITNFHLPESTLIMLVSAFLGREKTLAAYQTAIDERYRFFSFGDSMAIL